MDFIHRRVIDGRLVETAFTIEGLMELYSAGIIDEEQTARIALGKMYTKPSEDNVLGFNGEA